MDYLMQGHYVAHVIREELFAINKKNLFMKEGSLFVLFCLYL
jgi:hypothetical protein